MFKLISKWDGSAIDQKLKESKFLSVTFIQALRFLDERTPKQNNRQDVKGTICVNIYSHFRARGQTSLIIISCTENYLFCFNRYVLLIFHRIDR